MSKHKHPHSSGHPKQDQENDLLPEEEITSPGAEEPVNSETDDQQLQNLHTEIDHLHQQLEAAKAEAAEAKDTMLRKAADMENTKKRLQSEKEKSVRLANKGLLTDLLDVLDNFNRALSSVAENETATAVIDGVRLIENQLVNLLANKYDVKSFDSVGEIFNPERHEAIALGEPSESEEQIVLTEYQKGYTWGETILRTAKVVVSAPSAK